jgi:UDP-glucose 4-epimerase
MTTVVVTGAAGFIGRNVASQLAQAGLIVVRLSRRTVDDMRQVNSYADIAEGDMLIHLAEESRRHVVNASPEAAVQTSADTLRRLVRHFGSRVIYASSSVVYGNQHEAPCDVATPTIASDRYSRSKLINEQIVLEAGGSVARLSNLFGEGMAANNVLSDIIRQIPGHGPLRVRDETPIRDFLPVSDAAAAIVKLVELRHTGVVNIGSGIGLSIRDVALIMLSAAREAYRGVAATSSSTERSMNVLDISDTCRLLNWSPTMRLPDELARLITT